MSYTHFSPKHLAFLMLKHLVPLGCPSFNLSRLDCNLKLLPWALESYGLLLSNNVNSLLLTSQVQYASHLRFPFL